MAKILQDIVIKDCHHLLHLKDLNLTPREVQVIACLVGSQGSDKHIGQLLSLHYRSVESYVSHILTKLRRSSRQEIVAFITSSEYHKDFLTFYQNYVLAPFLWKKSFYHLKEDFKKTNCSFHISYTPLYKKEARHLLQSLLCLVKEENVIFSPTLNHLKTSTDWHIEKENQDWFITTPSLKKADNELSYHPYQSSLSQEWGVYHLFLHILMQISPNFLWEESIATLNQEMNATLTINPHTPQKMINYKKIILKTTSITLLCIIALIIAQFYTKTNRNKECISSVFVLPHQGIRLERSELHQRLHTILSSGSGIQSVALVSLVGMGGVGKTTLARLYAASSGASVIWEINAEHPDTIRQSFQGLATALATQKEDKEKLFDILEIEDIHVQESHLIQFVQQHLRVRKNWLLLYDNVDQILTLKKYLPDDLNLWGQGRIIITTRNANIRHTAMVNDVIDIAELTREECWDLFKRIAYEKEKHELINQYKEEIERLLEHIPNFPLDVAMAAHYIKDTGTTPATYLERLNMCQEEFDQYSQSIWKEVSEYATTRYSIIALSLSKLLNKSEDYADLLTCLASIDSQNINKNILENIKNPMIVDQFIHDLRQFSFLTSAEDNSDQNVFHMHRSLQSIMHAYLKKHIHMNPVTVAHALHQSCLQAAEKQDHPYMQALVNHLKAFISNSSLKEEERHITSGHLGVMLDYLGHYQESQSLLKNSTQHLNDSHPIKAYFLLHLAHTYRKTSDFSQALRILEKGLSLCEKQQDHHLTVRFLQSMGNTLRWRGDFKEALLVCEKSLNLNLQYNPSNHISMAENLTTLSALHREVGSYEKARRFMEKSLELYKRHLQPDDVRLAWALGHAGDLNLELGLCNEAKEFYTQSLSIYEKNVSPGHRLVAAALCRLGNACRASGDLIHARTFLEKGAETNQKLFNENNAVMAFAYRDLSYLYESTQELEKALLFAQKAYEAHLNLYGKTNMKTNRALSYWGYMLLKNGKTQEAEEKLLQATAIWKQINHPLRYRTMLHMGYLMLKKNDLKQAKQFMKQALQLAKEHLPPYSIYIQEIEEALASIH